MSALGHKRSFSIKSVELQLSGGDLKRSMQHQISNYREEDVENEAAA